MQHKVIPGFLPFSEMSIATSKLHLILNFILFSTYLCHVEFIFNVSEVRILASLAGALVMFELKSQCYVKMISTSNGFAF